jgi:hypothetical protein
VISEKVHDGIVEAVLNTQMENNFVEFQQRVRSYATMYLSNCTHTIKTHESPFLNQIAKIPKDKLILLKPTNRSGESRFGQAKNLLKVNSATRAIVIECVLRAARFSMIEIEDAIQQYSKRFHLSTVANELDKLIPSAKEIDILYAKKKQQKLQELDNEFSVGTLYERVIAVMLLESSFLQPPKTRVTKAVLRQYLSTHGILTTSQQSKQTLLLQLKPMVSNWFNETMQKVSDLQRLNNKDNKL